MHLDASKFMTQLAEQAHAVVLCGGTMSPVGDIISNVFPAVKDRLHVTRHTRLVAHRHIPPSRVDFRSFGHVVPQDSVLGLTVPSGPNGSPFQFSFGSRNSKEMMGELAQALVTIAESVPDGVVVFFQVGWADVSVAVVVMMMLMIMMMTKTTML